MQDPTGPDQARPATPLGGKPKPVVLAPVWPPQETESYLAAQAAFTHDPKDLPPKKQKRPRKPRKKPRGGFWLMPSLIFLALGLTFAALALTGKPLRLPVWAVAEVEAQLNTRLEAVLGQESGGTALSLGGIVVTVDDDWIPRLRLEDLRLLQPDGAALLAMPEFRVAFNPGALVQGKVRLRSLRVVGARLSLRRMQDGRFDVSLGRGMARRQVEGVSGLVNAAVALFSQPSMDYLTNIQAEALTVTIDDRLLGRVWEMGDGRMRLLNRADDLALELGVSLVRGGAEPAQADMTVIASKDTAEARLSVTVDSVAAADLATQAAPLAFLRVLDAPISGQIVSTLDADGGLASLEAKLAIAAGALRPSPQTNPVGFDEASMFFSYEPSRERIELHELTVRSPSLRVAASGQAYLPGVAQGVPSQVLGQIQFSKAVFDPVGLFEAPVQFDQGALDLRLRLNPFTLDIGQLTLQEGGRHLLASGKVTALPLGWDVGLDIALDSIAHDNLLRLWPEAVVPKTRAWVVDNVQDGQLSDVRAALRLSPGKDPKLSLGYEYSNGTVRFLKTLPPIQQGFGHATIDGKTYTQVLDKGFVQAPTGGRVDVAGTVFSVADITQKPAQAEIRVRSKGSLLATLSLLDQPPFQFLTKAGRAVDLGQGEVAARATIRMPLMKGVKINEVDYAVAADITQFQSDVLVPGRLLQADTLSATVTPEGLSIAGQGQLQGVSFDGLYRSGFAPDQRGKARVEGRAELSPENLDLLGVALPKGLLRGKTQGQFTVDLQRGQPATLRLRSDLQGAGLAVAQLGWSKPSASKGNLEMLIELGKPAKVKQLSLQAAGLSAKGQISLKDDGGLALAQFAPLKIGNWLEASVDLTGRGKGKEPSVAITGGRLDLRGLQRSGDKTATKSGGSAIAIALDRLTVSQGLDLTGFRTRLVPRQAGLSGDFTGRVNGQVPVRGSLTPTDRGTAVHLQGDDAGAVFSAAKIFPNAQGGSLDVVLQPTGAAGSYDGSVKIRNIRIRKAPALAELINAISVVGVLEQMNGTGLLFGEADAEFRLTPRALEITRGSAVGASLGVSVAGLYVLNGGRLDMQGVVSPIYLLNGIGALFTRKGEGLFGFNYHVQGTAKQPQVSVNPLSILTPGMFREIFRAPPPKLEQGE